MYMDDYETVLTVLPLLSQCDTRLGFLNECCTVCNYCTVLTVRVKVVFCNATLWPELALCVTGTGVTGPGPGEDRQIGSTSRFKQRYLFTSSLQTSTQP
jgi:hypothetical protein